MRGACREIFLRHGKTLRGVALLRCAEGGSSWLTLASCSHPQSQPSPYSCPPRQSVPSRRTSTPGHGDGEVHIDPTEPASPDATTVFKFKKSQVLMFEAGVMFAPDGSFGVATWSAGADVTIDVLGYLLPDPAPTGAKGDKGDSGE